jgi:hypothetical protein
MTKKKQTKTKDLDEIRAFASTMAHQIGGDTLERWGVLRSKHLMVLAGMKGRTGRPTDRDKALARLDELASDGPTTTALRRKVAEEFQKPLWRITRWDNERN